MPRSALRSALAAVGAFAMLYAACTSGSPDPEPSHESPPPPPEPGSLEAIACQLDHDILLRTLRGYRDGRSGELQMIPVEFYYVDGGVNHSGPWDYLQEVPLLLYGPGHIPQVGSVDRPVTVAALAPTYAELLDFHPEGWRPDGTPLTEALLPEGRRGDPPKLIVTLVWDAGGRIVLDAWPESHPVLDGLVERGVWYDAATVGSSPSATGAIHATIGTGVFPNRHGLVGNDLRIGDQVVGPWKEGPEYLLEPTLADLYDPARGSEPIAGVIGTTPWYLGMLGHGSAWEGGDADVAVLRPNPADEGAEGTQWSIPAVDEPFYRFPGEYTNETASLAQYAAALDAEDGLVDGMWMGHSIEELAHGFHTPARVPYQTAVIEEVIRREGFGEDEVPDLLYLNYKIIDEIGHQYFLNSEEMRATLAEQDEYLQVLIDFLDREVGQGAWVLALTADHGHTPDPEISGGFRIRGPTLKALISAAFDDDGDDRELLQQGKPTYLFLDLEEVEDNGFTVGQVAEYILGLTKADVAFPDEVLPEEEADDPVFDAAFPSEMLFDLPCLPEARA